MNRIKLVLWEVIKYLAGLVVATPFIALFVWCFLFFPASLIWETVDLLRMGETTTGTVTGVKYVRGSKSSWLLIHYTFSVNGQRYESERVLPGPSGKAQTTVGREKHQEIKVYYCRTNPAVCSLEYGWHKWSVGWTSMLVGGAFAVWAIRRPQTDGWKLAARCVATAFAAYGFLLIFFVTDTVRVRDLPWHILAWCIVCGGTAFYVWANDRLPVREPPQTEPAAESDQPRAELQTTPQLLVTVLFGGVIVAMLSPSWPYVISEVAELHRNIPHMRGFGGILTIFGVFLGVTVNAFVITGFLFFVWRLLRRLIWHATGEKDPMPR